MRGKLSFNLKPMSTYKGNQYVKPTVEQISFKLDFSNLTEIHTVIPPNADEAWKTICDPAEFVTFTDLVDRVEKCKNPSHILSVFDIENQMYEKSLLTIELSRHLSYICRIIPPAQFKNFFSKTRLDVNSLLSSLNQNEATCFNCSIQLLYRIISVIPEYEQKKMVLKSFAKLLIPHSLVEKRKTRSYITFLTFLPVNDSNGIKQWLCVHRNLNNCRTYLRGGKNDVLSNFSLDQLRPVITGNQISFYPRNVTNAQALLSFEFITEDGAQFWEDAISNTFSDPLICFLNCIPHVMQYISEVPDDFYQQFEKILEASDMDLVRGIFNGIPATLSGDAKQGVDTILTILANCGTLANFFRSAYAQAVETTIFPSTIFRENSPATFCSTLTFTQFGDEFSTSLIYALYSKYPNLEDAINAIINFDKPVPPILTFIFSCAFRSTRRKFPDNLTPLIAVNSILMLRYLLPKLSMISRQASQFGQRILNAFVFHKVPDDPLNEQVYRKIALYTSNISHPKKVGKNELPTPQISIVLNMFVNNSKQIMEELNTVLEGENQTVWGVLEFLENIFAGVEENYETLISKSTIFGVQQENAKK
ncbi:hypothetical protein GPJ56_001313 [Histomonas meleagridis]|uniref:uncharacterized protein n=1 Tax=Histomonas meleagridis TaxID=135588 RepID=UPI00355A8F68|nr:hypothetical protein GPJ56_001313 [Histomonas meleagridis]KAH0805070.1 hypothetical protein GO595_002015 [Histomonas meleagridis]